MFCIKCGTVLPEDAEFCYKCGTKISSDIQEPQIKTTQEKLLAHQQTSPKTNYSSTQNNKLYKLIGLLGSIIAILIIIVVVIKNSNTSNNNNSRPTLTENPKPLQNNTPTVANDDISAPLNDTNLSPVDNTNKTRSSKYALELVDTGKSEIITDENNTIHTIYYAKRVLTNNNFTLFILPIDSKENLLFRDDRYEIYDCECVPAKYSISSNYDFELKGHFKIISKKAYDSVALFFTLTDKDNQLAASYDAGAVTVSNPLGLLVPGEEYEFTCKIYAPSTAQYNATGFALEGISSYGEVTVSQDVIDSMKQNKPEKVTDIEEDKIREDNIVTTTPIPTPETINQNNLELTKTAYSKAEDFCNYYLMPCSSLRYINEAELTGFDAQECKLIRNEIYARHGRKFSDKNLREYFETKWWYYPYIEPSDFDEGTLNEYEIANINMIKEYEEKGCPYANDSYDNAIVRTVEFKIGGGEGGWWYTVFLEYTKNKTGYLTIDGSCFDLDTYESYGFHETFSFIENENLEGIIENDSQIYYTINYEKDYTEGSHIVMHLYYRGEELVLDESSWWSEYYQP